MAGTLLFLCAFYVRPSPVAAPRRQARLPEDLSVPAHAVARRSWRCCRPPASAAARPWRCRSCTWWPSAATWALPPARGSEAISLILLTAVASTFAMGRLSDYIGPIKVSLLCALIQIASLTGLRLRRKPVGHLHPVGDPRHSLHRHRAGLCADPAPALRPDHRRLAAGRGHAVRDGRHGGRRLAGRRHLRRHALLSHGLPGGAGLQPPEPDAARRSLFHSASQYLCVFWERATPVALCAAKMRH